MQLFQVEDLDVLKHIPSDHLSTRYKPVDSRDIVNQMDDFGFDFAGVSVANARKPQHVGFQKHLMVFNTPYKIDEENRIRVLCTNSYNGLTAVRFSLGIYRTVCANGLVVGQDFFDVRMRHKGSVQDNLELIYKEVANAVPKLVDNVITLSEAEYTVEEEEDFIINAIKYRHGEEAFENAYVDQYYDQFLPKRSADTAKNAYVLYNRVQERLVNGQYNYYNAKQDMFKKAKRLTAVDTVMNTNQFLWDETIKLAA